MAKRRIRLVGLLLAAAMLAVATLALYLGGFAGIWRRDDPQHLARGRALYGTYCAACHGANLEGQENWRQRGPDGLLPAPPHDETGHTWHHPDRQLLQITKFGTAALVGGGYQSAMTGFGDQLSDEDIQAILDFIKTRWPDSIRQRQAAITARAVQAQ